MLDKFQNKYRTTSIRLQNWDYGWSAAYSVTICTQNRVYYFGNIEEIAEEHPRKLMKLTPIGAIADVLWHEIKHHANHVELDAFIVMPNHIHGIIIINDDNGRYAETGHTLSLQTPLSSTEQQNALQKTIGQNRFQNVGKNTLSSIVGSYKSAVTKHANRLGLDFAWQPNYYEHIIRDEQAYKNISNYIINNPANWIIDKFYK